MLGISKRVLMCAPTFFGVSYAINPHMARSLRERAGEDPVDNALAQKQWQELVRTLFLAGIQVSFINPVVGLPDMVFTANAGFIHNGKIVLSNFRHIERRSEQEVFKNFFLSKTGFQVEELSPSITPSNEEPLDVYFEGHGDALFYQDIVFAGHGFRSNELGICGAMRHTNLRGKCLLLELINPDFYHLDTCFATIGDVVVYYPEAFSARSRKSLEDEVACHGGHLLSVSSKDAHNFVCNGVPVKGENGWRFITACPTKKLQKQFKDLNIEVWPVETGEFLKSGGGARCLVLFI